MPTRYDAEFRRVERARREDSIRPSARDARGVCRRHTRGLLGQKCRKEDLELEGNDVLHVGIRNGATAQRLPERPRIEVARRGKEEGVVRSAEVPLEEVEARRAGLWLHEIPARPPADEPLISRQQRVAEGAEEAPEDAPRIANTQAVS